MGRDGVGLEVRVVGSSETITGIVPKTIGVEVNCCVGGGRVIFSSKGVGITPEIIKIANPKIATKNSAAPAPPQPDFFFSGSVLRTAIGRFWTGRRLFRRGSVMAVKLLSQHSTGPEATSPEALWIVMKHERLW